MNILWVPITVTNIAMTALTGHVDGAYLAGQADALGVPREVVWAVMWQESSSGRKGNDYLGPGKWVTDTVAPDSIVRYRICRELGRSQINPCVYRSSDPRCTLKRIKENYADNVYCGIKKLKSLHERYGDWYTAVYRYNGSGPMARAYRARVESYIGRLYLHRLA